MKFRNKMSLIAGVAALALAGTGYAAWTFTKEVSQTVTVSEKVTAAIEAKNVTADPSTFYLIVDAPTAGGTNLKPGKGLYWASDAEGETAITTVKLTGKVNEADHDIADIGGYVGKFVITADALSTTYVSMAAVNKTETVTVESKDGDCEYTYTLPTVSYAKVPANVAEVTAMKAELSNVVFTVKFNVENSTAA